jgi:hypothetical protein
LSAASRAETRRPRGTPQQAPEVGEDTL